jgi:thiamine pyrophosphate-dependent acetolactate synthase large subunit-like protein
MVEQSKTDATIGWDSSPITTARMCAEVYAQIKDEDWSVVGTAIRLTWPHRLWDFKRPYQWNGVSGGGGVGYNLPASLGAASCLYAPPNGRGAAMMCLTPATRAVTIDMCAEATIG